MQLFVWPDNERSMAAGGRRSSWLEKPAMRGAKGRAPALAWYYDNDIEQEQDLKMEMFLFHESM